MFAVLVRLLRHDNLGRTGNEILVVSCLISFFIFNLNCGRIGVVSGKMFGKTFGDLFGDLFGHALSCACWYTEIRFCFGDAASVAGLNWPCGEAFLRSLSILINYVVV